MHTYFNIGHRDNLNVINIYVIAHHFRRDLDDTWRLRFVSVR